jgi:prevent-host-death family protein
MASQGINPAARQWQLQEAKSRFSEVVKQARAHGPQHVSVRGVPAVVVISEEQFAKLTRSRRSIVDHILDGPPWPDEVVDAINERSRDTGRDVGL